MVLVIKPVIWFPAVVPSSRQGIGKIGARAGNDVGGPDVTLPPVGLIVSVTVPPLPNARLAKLIVSRALVGLIPLVMLRVVVAPPKLLIVNAPKAWVMLLLALAVARPSEIVEL